MSSPSQRCSCTVWLREDTMVDLEALARRLEAGTARIECSEEPAPGLAKMLREALLAIRRAAIEHRELVHRLYRLKLEAIPPRLRGPRAWTGQWAGMLEHNNGECIRVIIEPKHEAFKTIYLEVAKSSHSLAKSLSLAVTALHLGHPGLLPSLGPAALLLDEYARRNPPYIVEEEPTRTPLLPPALAPRLKRLRRNTKYYATIIAAAAIIAKALQQPANPPRGSLAETMTRIYMERTRAILATLAPQLPLQEAPAEPGEPDTDTLIEIKAATRSRPKPGQGTAYMLLTPTPKIYEIYVLLKTLEAVKAKTGLKPKPLSLHTYHAAGLRIYYNRPPRTASRLVHRITGSRPHPDILIQYPKDTRVVVDAKYRPGLGLAPKAPNKLQLKEALRLLGYLADLAHNDKLQAILAVPEKAQESTTLQATLNGKHIEINIAEVNPTKGAKELITLLP